MDLGEVKLGFSADKHIALLYFSFYELYIGLGRGTFHCGTFDGEKKRGGNESVMAVSILFHKAQVLFCSYKMSNSLLACFQTRV